MDLDELYQEVIMDHARRPRNLRELPMASHRADGHNPLCGDQVTVHLKVEDGVIQEATFTGCGCAISTASASMMTDMVQGKRVDEVRDLARRFRDALVEHKESELGELEVLCGVRNFPMRVKCATLAWHTVCAALDAQAQPVTTEG